MHATTSQETAARRSTQPRIARRRPRAAHHQATALLDTAGRIRHCSEVFAGMAGRSRARLLGQHIRTLMPRFPLGPDTPGYNAAYAAFSGAAGQRHLWLLRQEDGAASPVRGQLSLLRRNGAYAIAIELWQPRELAPADLPAPMPGVTGASEGPPACPLAEGLAHPFPESDQCSACLQSRGHIRITLDRRQCIVYANSVIEPLLGYDFEKLSDEHVSTLLPDLLPRLRYPRTNRELRARLAASGGLALHARTARGVRVPVTVSLQDAVSSSVVPLLLRLRADQSCPLAANG